MIFLFVADSQRRKKFNPLFKIKNRRTVIRPYNQDIAKKLQCNYYRIATTSQVKNVFLQLFFHGKDRKEYFLFKIAVIII